MQPIICTEPMELVHVDYVGMEVTVSTQEKPVVNIMTNDWEARSGKMLEVAPGICAYSLQCYLVFCYGLFPVLLNVWPETPAPH